MREDIRFKVAFANAVSREQDAQLLCCSMAIGGTMNQCGQIASAESSLCTGFTYPVGAKCRQPLLLLFCFIFYIVWDLLARVPELCAAPPIPCRAPSCVPTPAPPAVFRGT